MDVHSAIQGPFPTNQMRYWYETGCFFDSLLLSYKSNEWKTLKDYFPQPELAFLTLVGAPSWVDRSRPPSRRRSPWREGWRARCGRWRRRRSWRR